MYIEAALKNWSPTYGKKKKVKAESEEKHEEKHEYTAEERAAMFAWLKALEATLDPDD